MIFTEQEIYDIKRMIQSHEIATGDKPLIVQWPLPKDCFAFGVPVKFYLGSKAFTCSEGHVVHHSLPDYKSKPEPYKLSPGDPR